MEAKQIADAAEAARVYLERTHASAETVNRATEIRLLAERQIGEFPKVMPKAMGTRGQLDGRNPDGSERSGPSREEGPETQPTLAEIGITYKQSSRAQQLADIPVEEFKERVAVAKAGFFVATRRARRSFGSVAAAIGCKSSSVLPQSCQTCLFPCRHVPLHATKMHRADFEQSCSGSCFRGESANLGGLAIKPFSGFDSLRPHQLLLRHRASCRTARTRI